ncbi:MAG: hypothetical protein KF773_26640 [Deltaproteobacteria bacterium]|nr:hypothetical protein [Deltaproteobacteria bacterium]
MHAIRSIAVAFTIVLAGCSSDILEEDPIDEPELSAQEASALPEDVADADEHAPLAQEPPQHDDTSAFDDDFVLPPYDVEVDETGANLYAAQGLLKAGLHPRASDALRAVGVTASRITQTVGSAPASAGVHLADGTVDGKAYTAAVDLSTSGMTEAQIHNLLEKLGKVGYAAWYRKKGFDGWNGANHIHGVYANCKMKEALRSQVRSWLVGRNGLVSNTTYKWHAFSGAAKSTVKAKFAQSKSGTTNGGAGFAARINTSGAPLTIRKGASTATEAISSVADGAIITISCQKLGQSVTGTYGTSKLWDKIGAGFVADAYVYTGSDGRVAPDCP